MRRSALAAIVDRIRRARGERPEPIPKPPPTQPAPVDDDAPVVIDGGTVHPDVEFPPSEYED